MVNRFLSWKLPENFNPDGGISFKRDFNENTPFPMKHEPSGTNLFDYTQAVAMVRHMVDGLPPALSTASSPVSARMADTPVPVTHLRVTDEMIRVALLAFQSGDMDWSSQDEELMRFALEEALSATVNVPGSNGETLEKSCTFDPNNDPKNENIQAPVGHVVGARPMETAPKDNTLVRLLVDYSGEDGDHPLEDAEQAWTIGFNNFEDSEVDEWQFAGWSWSQDCFCEGRGRVIGWAPFHPEEVKANG